MSGPATDTERDGEHKLGFSIYIHAALSLFLVFAGSRYLLAIGSGFPSCAEFIVWAVLLIGGPFAQVAAQGYDQLRCRWWLPVLSLILIGPHFLCGLKTRSDLHWDCAERLVGLASLCIPPCSWGAFFLRRLFRALPPPRTSTGDANPGTDSEMTRE